MDYRQFMQTLPTQYHAWNTAEVRPIDGCFAEVLESVASFTSPCVLQLLSHAVSFLENGERYAEVGTFQGGTLIGALLRHPTVLATAIDNFSEFDPHGTNHHALGANLSRFGLQDRVEFLNASFEQVFLENSVTGGNFGVYLYDGIHDYRSQLLGLQLAIPHLAERALIIVDDSNFPAAKQAAWDFVALRPEASVLAEVRTPGNRHPTFWNGLMLLSWDRQSAMRPPWALLQSVRQTDFLESLKLLENVRLSIAAGRIHVSAIPT